MKADLTYSLHVDKTAKVAYKSWERHVEKWFTTVATLFAKCNPRTVHLGKTTHCNFLNRKLSTVNPLFFKDHGPNSLHAGMLWHFLP
jgi:hypothetical protein